MTMLVAVAVALTICLLWSEKLVVGQSHVEVNEGLVVNDSDRGGAAYIIDHLSPTTTCSSSSSSSSTPSTLPDPLSNLPKKKNENNKKKKNYTWIPEAEHPCNIRRLTLSQLFQQFGPYGVPSLYPTPLIIDLHHQEAPPPQHSDDDDVTTNHHDPWIDHANYHFRNLTQLSHLLHNFPSNFTVTLSSSNSYSEHRRIIPLSQYLHETTASGGETLPDVLSNETWYLFGETYTAAWQDLLNNYYTLPPCHSCRRTHRRSLVALAFGIGNRGSGVQWHVHGPGFSQALHGRKHWILSETKPIYHPNTTSRFWMEYEYPKYNNNATTPTKRGRDQRRRHRRRRRTPTSTTTTTTTTLTSSSLFYECTLLPGDLLYFPNNWYHATINLDPYTAFVSSFTTEHTAITGMEL